jgi:hypothetical protein
VSNIFRVNATTKEINAMSNSVTGLFRPVQIDDEKLFAFNFTSNGFQPVYIPNQVVEDVETIEFLGNITVEKYPQLVDWQLPIPSAADINIDSLTINEGTYQPGKLMAVNYGYPTVVGYKNHVGLGYKMNFSDPFKFRELEFSVAYTPKTWKNGLSSAQDDSFDELGDDELLHISFSAKAGRFSLQGGYNEADFYDLFGPTKSSRKGVNVGLDYDQSLIFDPPHNLDLNIGISGFYGLDQSPEFQQIVATGFNNNFFLNLDGYLSYSYLSGSLGGVDAEKGVSATLWGAAAWSAGNVYPRVMGTFNYGIQLPVNHMSLWFRTAAGNSFSDTFNPFTRFGFAAFGNNYVDYQSTRRYRGPFSFPGVAFDSDKSIIASRFGKGLAELVFPPIRFRKMGGFNFFANWIQPSIFSSVLWAKDVNFKAEKFANLGAQLDLRMVMFSLLPSTISIGYARAWEIGNADTDARNEFMISLKLLR